MQLSQSLETELNNYPLEVLHDYIRKREEDEIRNIKPDIEDENTTEEDDEDVEDDKNEEDVVAYTEEYLEKCYEIIKTNIHLLKEQKYWQLLSNEIQSHLSIDDINHIMYSIFGLLIPFRSIKTYTPDHVDKSVMQQHITWLRNLPQPEQRTPEWYTYRHTRVTASSAWKILDTKSQVHRYIWDKCQELNLKKFETTSLNTPFHWGHKYEPLASLYYEHTYNTKIEDFGCIPHETEEWLAASPDGINVDPNSTRFGRMLEIKNIVNREITGIPKKEYWIQMQLQMEVCQLPECDFLECRFKEYDGLKEYKNDGSWNETKDGKLKGIILMFNHPDEMGPHYEYPSRLGMMEYETTEWENRIIQYNEEQGRDWIQTIYWYLDEVSCVLVERNTEWFNSVKTQMKECWETIQHEKKNGFSHREPKKRPLVNKEVKKIQGCVLTISTDDL